MSNKWAMATAATAVFGALAIPAMLNIGHVEKTVDVATRANNALAGKPADKAQSAPQPVAQKASGNKLEAYKP